MLRDSGNNPVSEPTDKITAQDTLLYCDVCKEFISFWPLSEAEKTFLLDQCFPLIYKDITGENFYYHICTSCFETEGKLIKKEELRTGIEAWVTSIVAKRTGDLLVTLNKERAEHKNTINELQVNFDKIQEEAKEATRKYEAGAIAHKRINAALQALELKLGKQNADQFAALWREPLLISLIDEAEDIIRRFNAGPPNNEQDLQAFVEKVKSWIARSTTARQSSQTHKTIKAQEAIAKAFHKEINPTGTLKE